MKTDARAPDGAGKISNAERLNLFSNKVEDAIHEHDALH